MANLRIMSNNIWWADSNSSKWAAKGEDCSSPHRAKGFARMYADTKPDIIGLQECAAILTDNIMCNLKNTTDIPYALLWGRDTPIIYRTDKFDLVDSDYFIYSEDVPNLNGSFNNHKTKSYCIGVFRIKENGNHLIFGTTHLWYKTDAEQEGSEVARVYQLSLFMDKLEQFKSKYNCHVIMVGDFNTVYNSDTVQSAIKRGYTHAYHLATDYKDETCGHHVCNSDHYERYDNPMTFNESIDHILTKDMPNDSVKSFDRYYPDYYFPLSDHFPVFIDVDI